jgi:hypothetical protein
MMLTWMTGWLPDETPARKARTTQSSQEWRDYFRAHVDDLRAIPWDAGLRITPEELAEIADSLRAWALGESSDGNHLRAAAQKYAQQTSDPAFFEAIELFIAEEQRHGATLGRFLDLAGVPRVERDWGDSCFRALRYCLPNMETWTTPVLLVEVHALVYYNAIRNASGCPVLRAICEQLLADEIPHIRFQCERLGEILRDRPRWLYALTMLLHRVFFTGVTLAVWIGHRRALRAGGYGFGRFWRSAWSKMNHAWRQIDEAKHAAKTYAPAACAAV